MGANHIGEIARLTKIAPPDIAVVLKVGVAHLGEFGSVKRIAHKKERDHTWGGAECGYGA